ncbi:hypothetical protein SOCEGT47_012800 [Sorangium cellulosum]|uniref:Secreted protein n=1 Tax=Sorangium cellulosum TaxID=56 RepID=A0A4P2PWD3_SORCE|nr:hypothetical protein [Sorangium cellulosum]AUX20806.1 hypothetical protein SOCEGT47_012800 [Sorangium cellulosum]
MRSILRSMFTAAMGLSLAACAAAPPPATRAPGPPGDGRAAPAPPPPPLPEEQAFAVHGPLKDEWLPMLKPAPFDPKSALVPSSPIGVPAPPAACDAFARRAAAPAPACGDAQGALAALDAALAEGDPARRDARLAGLEACAGLEAGLARALRVELAPAACGDALTAPLLEAPPAGLRGDLYQVLLGQTLAARLARTAIEPPTLRPPYDVQRVVAFTKGPLFAWVTEQARAIEDLGRLGVALPFYAKGIVAVEAGRADMRLVEAVRSAPLPDAMRKDAELGNVYYGELDQLLEPWKQRGRDAALVGLRELSSVGVLRDARVEGARAMLSRLYGGRRVDALDALALPELPPAAPSSLEERLAGALPTYYAGRLLPPEAAARPGTLRMFLERGVPLPHRAALRAAELSPEARLLYARARLELGRLYWRAVDFDQATALLTAWPEGAARPAEATMLLALALGLRNGPEDAALMMRRAPLAGLGLGELAALDWVARAKPASPYAGLAAYDAALIKQIAAPQGADAGYWSDVAARFREAQALLSGPLARAAEERARAADEIARAAAR